jgi:hypothetical protein
MTLLTRTTQKIDNEFDFGNVVYDIVRLNQYSMNAMITTVVLMIS